MAKSKALKKEKKALGKAKAKAKAGGEEGAEALGGQSPQPSVASSKKSRK